jgi:hypothetical protein
LGSLLVFRPQLMVVIIRIGAHSSVEWGLCYPRTVEKEEESMSKINVGFQVLPKVADGIMTYIKIHYWSEGVSMDEKLAK